MHLFTCLLEQRTLALAILASGVVAGVAVPAVTEHLERHALPALFLVVVLSMTSLARAPRSDLLSGGRDVWRLVLWQQVFLPCFVVSVGILAQLPDSLLTLMTVTACAGSLFASPMLAELLGLDRRHALLCMVTSTFTMPASLYIFLTLFHGLGESVYFVTYAERVGIFLVIPVMLLGIFRLASRRISTRTWNRVDSGARWVSVAALLVFAMGMMHPVSDLLSNDPGKALLLLGLSTVLMLGMAALTATVMFQFSVSVALTGAVLSGFRNVGLAFALVGPELNADLTAYVGLAMLPMFIAPLVIRLVSISQSQAAAPIVSPTPAGAST